MNRIKTNEKDDNRGQESQYRTNEYKLTGGGYFLSKFHTNLISIYPSELFVEESNRCTK